jgi:hypothetical protein
MSFFWYKPATALIAASIVFTVLVGDILIAKAQVMMGASNPLHLGDTVQFILLLLTVVLFVVGTLQKEALAERDNKEEN